MKYNKPALNLAEQKNLLASRGLKVNNPELLDKLLRQQGYSRFDLYCTPFIDFTSNRFARNVSVSQIYQVIYLDESLRNFILPQILSIELALKASFVETLAQRGGAFAYTNAENFNDENLHVKLLAHASDSWLRSSDWQALNFRRRYAQSKMPPIWYLVQTLPLGAVSKWLGNLKSQLSKEVLNTIGLPSHRLFIETGIPSLTILRNSCAHGAKVWNTIFPISFCADYSIETKGNPRKLAAAMYLIEMCLSKINLQSNDFMTQRQKILDGVPKWQLKQMGYIV